MECVQVEVSRSSCPILSVNMSGSIYTPSSKLFLLECEAEAGEGEASRDREMELDRERERERDRELEREERGGCGRPCSLAPSITCKCSGLASHCRSSGLKVVRRIQGDAGGPRNGEEGVAT